MQTGDDVRVIKGEHAGKIGVVMGRYQAGGLASLKDPDFSDMWMIVFEDDGKRAAITKLLMQRVRNSFSCSDPQ